MKHIKRLDQYVNEMLMSGINSVEDLSVRARGMAKTKADNEFVDLILSAVEKIGIDKVTGFQRRTHGSGKTIAFEFNDHITVYYSSAWKGISGEKYPAQVTIDDTTGKIIKRDGPKPNWSKKEGGSVSFSWNAKGKRELENWIVNNIK